ncbi:uncharacterized protein LOC133918332 [Phragmites australis]|uniref:uncharacterized protein LOC133918332 n=1 Tax=Phragmites australis TaxID=29695 RepID=UPI002D78198D|nr:uncharacterized protein LOC133918332 [Phragmites australis]
MAATRRLFSFHLHLGPRASARPFAAAVATPHHRGKHDAVMCKAAGKSKAKASKGGERLQRRALEEHLKRRTRSAAAFDADLYGRHANAHHVPVLLGEVLAAFRRPRTLRSFVDCTLGAAGHSLAMMEAHPEMELYIGMDIDPSALEIGRGHIEAFLAGREANRGEGGALQGTLRAYTHVKNFKYIKQVLGGVDESLAVGLSGVDGILIDLGMSSMQVNRSNRGFSVLQDGPLDMRMDPKATLRAEDILNSWPELEVGRVLRDYGEESNWQSLQKQIVKARATGGLHSTGELVKLIQRMCTISRGRQGWIKTATRVFQALRIAVNDELRTLEDALHSCFDCLGTGGRLAVISFHSLEDRIVKQTFLDLIHGDEADEPDDEDSVELTDINDEDEPWFKQRVQGKNGAILTKRPITPCQEEEELNQRCRSAKLRVIQKS